MKPFTSRKLIGAVSAMLAIVGVVLGSEAVGGVDADTLRLSIGIIAALGGYQIARQAAVDQEDK